MMKRLLLVTTVPETLATILREQPSFLADRFDVQLATSPGPKFESVVMSERVPVFPVSMARGIDPVRDMKSVFQMVRLLRRVRPNLVHSYTPKAGLIVMMAGFMCRVPVRIHTFTGLIFPTERGIKQRMLIWVDRLICALATRVVPEGAGVKSDLLRFKITKKPLEVIGFGNIAGVNVDYYSTEAPGVVEAANRLRGEIQLPGGTFVFCYVGRLNRDKGIRELVAAFLRLPDSAHLLVVGELDASSPVDGETLDLLESQPRIHRLGFVQDIRSALAVADVVVLPSYREGFPNVILQAGAMSLPAIATDINGCNEVIEPGFNGWLVSPRSAESLHAAMMSAMSLPPHELEQLGRRARDRICQRFERREHWDRMVNFYERELGIEKVV